MTTGPGKVYKITETVFEESSFRDKLYQPHNKQGETVYYAVCPRCDNPIQIIGLYRRSKLYGRHLPHSVPGLAEYRQEAYDFCPYAKPQLPDPKARKPYLDERANQFLTLLKKQFDRVIYLLSRDTGVSISFKLASQLLEQYLRDKGYLYPWTTLGNLPWIFGHMAGPFSLFGRTIAKASPLRKAIETKYPRATFNDQNHLVAASKDVFLALKFVFLRHRMRAKDESLEETLDFAVHDGPEAPGAIIKPIYRETLKLDQAYFLNLVHASPEKTGPYRDQKLLELAKKLIG
ncbi:MAG: hypothetical protein LBV21_01835 [Candidatus Adiutrix sp.]|nr:hypothetical protein [Candidatus Adiutrix sp.]